MTSCGTPALARDIRRWLVIVRAQCDAKRLCQARRREHSLDVDGAPLVHPFANCAFRYSHRARCGRLRASRIGHGPAKRSGDFPPGFRETNREVRTLACVTLGHDRATPPLRCATRHLLAMVARTTKRARLGFPGRPSASDCCSGWAQSRPWPGAKAWSAKCLCAPPSGSVRRGCCETPLPALAKLGNAYGARKFAHEH